MGRWVSRPGWAGGRAARSVTLAWLVLSACAARAQQHAGQYEQPDIEYGARLYKGHCITCHGERGDSIPGVSLGSNRFRRAASDRDLTTIIRDGIAGTAMAPSAYSDSELAAVVAYLRNMSRADLGTANLGNAERGRALFFGKGGCNRCHRAGADGPRAAPDLTNIGVLRTAATLQRALLDPNEALLPINRPVRAVLRDGTVVTGRRLNEDTHTVQIIDERERLVSLDKAALREYSLGNDAKMPSYEKALDETERADLVAFLLSLKGE